MSGNRLLRLSLAILACLGVLLSAHPALACAVCYGDPNSAMTQGAQAGVVVLLGVVGTVLTGLAALLIFWMRRAAHLEAEAGEAAREASS
jgi:hypothetical protein